jgi:hypothetical protein
MILFAREMHVQMKGRKGNTSFFDLFSHFNEKSFFPYSNKKGRLGASIFLQNGNAKKGFT